MPKPPRGDYHLAQVVKHWKKGNTERPFYYAHCTACMWVGPDRIAFDAAADDAVAHDTTEND